MLPSTGSICKRRWQSRVSICFCIFSINYLFFGRLQRETDCQSTGRAVSRQFDAHVPVRTGPHPDDRPVLPGPEPVLARKARRSFANVAVAHDSPRLSTANWGDDFFFRIFVFVVENSVFQIYKKLAEKIDTKNDTDEKAVLRKRAMTSKAQQALQNARMANISETTVILHIKQYFLKHQLVSKLVKPGLPDLDDESTTTDGGFVVVGNESASYADLSSFCSPDDNFVIKAASHDNFCTPRSNFDRTLQLSTPAVVRSSSRTVAGDST